MSDLIAPTPATLLSLTAEERSPWSSRVWQLLNETYQSVPGGLHFSSPAAMLEETPTWEILQTEEELLAVLLYKPKHGDKLVAFGATQNPTRRRDAVRQLGQRIGQRLRSAWLEVSEQAEAFVLRHGGESFRISNRYAAELTGKPILNLNPDGFHYVRHICGLDKQKLILGTPL